MREFDLLAVWYVLIFGVFVPYLVFRSRRLVKAGVAVPSRKKIFANVVAMQLVFLLVALVAVRAREFDLFAAGALPVPGLGLAAVMLGAGVATRRVHWEHTPEAMKRRLLVTRPQEPGEMFPWVGVSAAAAIVEEIVYRGVMVWLLIPMLGGWWPAVTVSVVAFALAHLTQGWQRVGVVALFALGAHGLVRLTGSLYTAMAVHFLHNVLAGIFYVRAAAALGPAPSRTAPRATAS